MNQGVIIGTVSPVNDTIIRFDGVWAGHVENRLNVFNPKNGLSNNLGLFRADENDRFLIPFEWEEHDVGDFMGARFRVAGFDSVVNRFDTFSGTLQVGRDWKSQFESAATEMIEDGLWELAQMSLAPAVKTVLSPSLSTHKMIAVGTAHLDI